MTAPAHLRLVRSKLTESELLEVTRVDEIVRRLVRHMQVRASDIEGAHVYNAQSKAVQSVIETLLCAELGFRSEVVLTPQEGFVSSARPDCVLELASGRGVVAEVERGGTVNNNHDLKDLWKAHVAADLQHLILIVPQSNWKSDGSARERPFKRVSHRLSAFFGDPRREIDVLSCHILGYGR